MQVVAVAAAKWKSLGVEAAHVIRTSKEVKSWKETIGRVAEGRTPVAQMTLQQQRGCLSYSHKSNHHWCVQKNKIRSDKPESGWLWR